MIDYGVLTKDDNDIITLLSNYYLYKDASLIKKHITQLAEKGQINAINAWTVLRDKFESNPTIEKHINSFIDKQTCTYEEYIVLSNYFNNDYDNERVLQLTKRMTEFKKTSKPDHYSPIYDELCKRYIEDQQELSKIPSVLHTKSAAKALQSILEYNKKPVIMEKYAELVHNSAVLHDNAIYKYYGCSTKKIRKLLAKELKANPDEPRLQFAMARNLLHFGNDKQKQLGVNMLDLLATRELAIEKQDILKQEDKNDQIEKEL